MAENDLIDYDSLSEHEENNKTKNTNQKFLMIKLDHKDTQEYI